MTTINLAIGPSCFVRCPGCYNYFENTSKRGGLISMQEVLDFAIKAVSIGVAQATVSGGDPLTHPEIVPILRGLSELRLAVKLDTVGTALLRHAPKKFYGDGESTRVHVGDIATSVHTIGFPVDGPSEEVAQQFRMGRTAILSEVVSAIRLSVRAGIRVSVNTVVHSGNMNSLRQIAELAADAGAREWQVFEYSPIGPLGSRNAAQFTLSPGRFAAVTDNLRQHASQIGLELTSKSNIARQDSYFLIDDAGFAWQPNGAKRNVMGHITRDRIRVLDQLKLHLAMKKRIDNSLSKGDATGASGSAIQIAPSLDAET